VTSTAARPVADIPRLTRATDAREVASSAYDDLLGTLDGLGADDWGREVPDCPGWSVADVVGHLIGAARAHASTRELIRQMRHARRGRAAFDGNELDAQNDLQVREHAALRPEERVAQLRALAPAAVDGRMRTPALLRAVRAPMATGGSTAAGMPTSLRIGNLTDAILTRDVWMHRVDIARAVGCRFDVDSDVDRRIVADVVAEWAATHGRPFVADLTGPAGGHFRQGEGGPRIERDAVEFCRALSGRAPAEGLLSHRVLF
jgi:uncharacterized protein (TIGR03083 family)